MNIILAIPTYNCEKQIQRVIEELQPIQNLFSQIWIVDNRSTDSTLDATKKAIREFKIANAQVFMNQSNVNLGGTHKKVFKESIIFGATHIAILHGDNQATTSELAKLITKSEEGDNRSVLGARFMAGSKLVGYSSKRIWGNKVLNFLYSVVSGRKLKDLGSGINLFNVSDINQIDFRSFGNGLTFNYELILSLVSIKSNFVFEPITWSESDQKSNAKNIEIFTEALKILLRWKSSSAPEKVELPIVEWESK